MRLVLIKARQNYINGMFKRILLILLIALPVVVFSFGTVKKTAKKPAIHAQLKTDSGRIHIKNFNADIIKKFRADPAFQYIEVKSGITWWDRFWAWVWLLWTSFRDWVAELFRKMFGSVALGQSAASVMKYVILGVAAVALVYVIFKLLGISLLNIFSKKKNTVDVPYTESLENIHEINFDEAIESALAIKNYRLAVRLLYLRSLKQLSDNKLINWKTNKTNTAYLNEITDAEQRRQFSIVTRQFEYVWYGDFPVDSQSFQSINAIFQEFKQRIV